MLISAAADRITILSRRTLGKINIDGNPLRLRHGHQRKNREDAQTRASRKIESSEETDRIHTQHVRSVLICRQAAMSGSDSLSLNVVSQGQCGRNIDTLSLRPLS
jgi:sigma54-dependent transcription regulator